MHPELLSELTRSLDRHCHRSGAGRRQRHRRRHGSCGIAPRVIARRRSSSASQPPQFFASSSPSSPRNSSTSLAWCLIGGLLLLWVCWKLWRELHSGGHAAQSAGADALDYKMDQSLHGTPVDSQPALVKPKTFRQALTQIIVADVSMSLDNVLAVAGTARHHLWVLVVGLALSVALMGIAATMIAGILRAVSMDLVCRPCRSSPGLRWQ